MNEDLSRKAENYRVPNLDVAVPMHLKGPKGSQKGIGGGGGGGGSQEGIHRPGTQSGSKCNQGTQGSKSAQGGLKKWGGGGEGFQAAGSGPKGAQMGFKKFIRGLSGVYVHWCSACF